MPIKPRVMAWLLLLICMVPAMAFAGTRGTLVGRVHDEEGNPIPGVAVTVTSPQIKGFRVVATTDKKGVFSVEFSQVDVTYHYRFDKVGFQSMEVDQEWHLEGTQLFEWTMHPGKSAAEVGGPPPASTSEPAIEAYNAAVLALRSKDNATAEAKLKESVGFDPKLRQAWALLATVETDLGHPKDAVDAAEKAIALGSNDQAVLLARWQGYRDLKEDAKAAEALKEMQRVGQQAEEAKKFHNEGAALLKAKDYAGAYAKFQDALKLDPNLEPSLLGLAEAGLKSGHVAEAATAVETVLKNDPKNEQAIRLRFNACLALGDKARLADALIGIAPYEPAMARNGLLKFEVDAYYAKDMALTKKYGDEIEKLDQSLSPEQTEKIMMADPNYRLSYYYQGLAEISFSENAKAKAHLERFLDLTPKDKQNDKDTQDVREMIKYLGKS